MFKDEFQLDPELESQLAEIAQRPTDGPKGGHSVKISVAGAEPKHVEYVPGKTIEEVLRESGVTWTSKSSFFQNGQMVELDTIVQPNATINVVGPMAGGI